VDMIRVRLRHLRKCGAVQARTYTSAVNVPSMRSLVRCGFLPCGTFYHDGVVFIQWQRRLK
jgi:hypothetical protein